MKNRDEQNSILGDDIRNIAKELQVIYAKAESSYEPIVNDIIRTNSKDENEIERVLDFMLDFADSEKILALFKDLCRYYYGINPQAATDYVRIYKELYEMDEP